MVTHLENCPFSLHLNFKYFYLLANYDSNEYFVVRLYSSSRNVIGGCC